MQLLADFEMEADFLDYHMVHASPESPADWNYILAASEAERNFGAFTQSFCLVGHSHQPVVFCREPNGRVSTFDTTFGQARPDCRYIINVGSVGQPRDGNRDACYLIADTETGRFEYRRVPYDVEIAQGKMKKARLPDYLIARLASGR
jgi:diadenosine tetraphosphatase ApaH/serine/threonine PP2A family protein phosphatase